MSSENPCVVMQSDEILSSHQLSMIFTSAISVYFILIICTFPFVRVHTPVPILFLYLILLFPPSFLILVTYILILRLGFMTTWWYISSQEAEVTEATDVQVEVTR